MGSLEDSTQLLFESTTCSLVICCHLVAPPPASIHSGVLKVGKQRTQVLVKKPPTSLFIPESVIVSVKGEPTVQCIVVWTEFVVVVGFEPAVQPFGPRVGPNAGAWATHVLPQWASVTTVNENESDAVSNVMMKSFIASFRSSRRPFS